MIEYESNDDARGTLSSWEQVRRRQRSLDAAATARVHGGVDALVLFPTSHQSAAAGLEDEKNKCGGEGDLLLDELLEMMASEDDALEEEEEEEENSSSPISSPPSTMTTMKEEMVEIATPVTPTWGMSDAAWHQWARDRSRPVEASAAARASTPNHIILPSLAEENSKVGPPTTTPKKVPQNVSRFPGKLTEVLSQPSLQHVCRWDSHHRAVVVLNFEVFCAQVLPTHFTLNPKSFHRQLNYYGFEIHKPPTSLGPRCKIWVNRDHTVRELKDLLRLRRFRKPHKPRKNELWINTALRPPKTFDSAVQVTPPQQQAPPFSTTLHGFYDYATSSSPLPRPYLRSTCIPGKQPPNLASPTLESLRGMKCPPAPAPLPALDVAFPLIESDIILPTTSRKHLYQQERCRPPAVAPRVECATY